MLSKLASTKKIGHLKTIIQETLQPPTVDTKEVMIRKEKEPDWMNPYKNFLTQGVLPPNESEAQRLKRKASYYIILDGELFRRGLTTPFLKCLNNLQADYIMRDFTASIWGALPGNQCSAHWILLAET